MPRSADPARTQAILDAANAIIDEGGFADMRMTDVARRAGMAVGTLYLYFPSKHDVMRALGARLFARAAEFLIAMFDRPLNRARIRTMVDALLVMVDDERELLRVVGQVATDASTPYTVLARTQLVHRVAQSLERQASAGTIRVYPDADALADYVVMLIRRAAIAMSTMERDARDSYRSTLALLLENVLLPAPAHRPTKRARSKK
jgi:AcrR family transcriptional regulator